MEISEGNTIRIRGRCSAVDPVDPPSAIPVSRPRRAATRGVPTALRDAGVHHGRLPTFDRGPSRRQVVDSGHVCPTVLLGSPPGRPGRAPAA